MNKKKHKNSAIILAAGLSERMGTPKFLLTLGKHTFVEKLLSQYRKFGCNEIVLVVNERDFLLFEKLKISMDNLKIVINKHPELGRFYSLKLGLIEIASDNNCFISNVDNPYAQQAILDEMYRMSEKENYVIPVYNGSKGHPILIGSKIVKDISKENILEKNIKIFLKSYPIKYCNVVSNNILVNVNTLEDYNLIKIYEKDDE